MNDYFFTNKNGSKKRISREEWIKATGYAPRQFRERHVEVPEFRDGGEPEYTYLELDDNAIQQYKNGGWVVEEMPEYEEGGNVIS
jgi:hypothetical protein